uniref:GON-4-like protein n=1 Tax=Lygus hesperus TaxID=30085 RepID=A0A146LK59_LYGHE
MESEVTLDNENKPLPSMPLLFTSTQSQPGSPQEIKLEDSRETEPAAQSTPEKSENESEKKSPEKESGLQKEEGCDVAYISVPAEEGCDELVIRANNSMQGEKRKSTQFNNHPPPKKKRKLESFELPEGLTEEPGAHYAEAYFTKLKSTLDESLFQSFIAILSEAQDEPGGAVKLYKKVEELLHDYPELVEDFVGTLKPHQALEIGKFVELKFIYQSLSFFRKLEGFQLTKLIHALEQMSSNANITYDDVKANVLLLFKGHGPLADSFLHLFPNEKPPTPSSIVEYEDVTEAMQEEGDDGGWENVRVPEHQERGCLVDCACRCHATPSQPFCLACNIRFIKGQAYVQYGKVIRYCKVHFGDMSHDEVLQRFNPALYSKRRRKKKSIAKPPPAPNDPFKSELIFQDENAVISKEDIQPVSSPCRITEEKVEEEDDYMEEDDVSSGDKSSIGDVFEDLDRHSEDTEDRLIGQLKNPISPLGATVDRFYFPSSLSQESLLKSREGVSEGVVIDVSDIRPNGVTPHVIKFETRASDDPCIKAPPSPSDSILADSPRDVIRDATVVFDDCEIHPKHEFDCIQVEGTPVIIDVSDIPRCVKLEEQENSNSYDETPVMMDVMTSEVIEADPLNLDFEQAKSDELKEWTRQEDKMILEAFQREVGTEETFSRIRNLMPARSVDQIQGRFQVLMNLLEKVASGSHDALPN